MNTLHHRVIALSLVCVAALTPAIAQPAPRTPADTVKTVEVSPDHRVTFRIYAPDATSVTVGGDFQLGGPKPSLTKDAAGVWSYTTPPIPPDSYTYNFTVDGVGVLDTHSASFQENPNSLFNFFDMPSPETDFMAVHNVPHGRVETVLYHSSTFNMERQMHVYLPPHFEKLKGPLPVLYLLHGVGDNDLSWVSAGQVPTILDNLYAAGKLKNMIVVMPNGTVPESARGGTMASMSPGIDDPFSSDFLNDIMPFVERTYPVSTRREDTAIAGFSMGGVQTLKLAVWHPEKFAYVFPVSTGFFPASIEEIETKDAAVLKNVAAHPFIQLYFGCGKDDHVMGASAKATMQLFDKFNIPYHYTQLPGGHSFVFARRFLALAFPLAFSGQHMTPDTKQ